MTNDIQLLVQERKLIDRALHEALDSGSHAEQRRLATAMEDVLNRIQGNDETVFGLGCRALIAEARQDVREGARYRKLQIDRMLAARSASETSGLDSVYRQMLAEVDETELDDNFDDFADDEIIGPWRMMVLDLWEGLCYEESLTELLKLKQFGEFVGIEMEDLDHWSALISEHKEMP